MDKETVNSLVSEAQHIAENAGNLIMTFFDELAEEEVEYKADQSPVTSVSYTHLTLPTT